MSEQEQVPNGEGPEPKEKEYSPVELKAMEMGWRPVEEFDGDEADFVDAKEFVGRAPLYETISHTKRELKQVRQAVEALKTHYTTVRETEYKRAIAALKAEQEVAIDNGDGKRHRALGDEIDALTISETQMRDLREQTIVQDQQMHPDLQAWVTQNPWYTQHGYMRQFAEEYGTKLYNQGMEPKEVLKKVTEAVKKEFPNKFHNPNKESAPNVTGGDNKPAKGSVSKSLSALEASLDDGQRNIMNTLLRQKKSDGTPLMTKEKYLQELQEAKAG